MRDEVKKISSYFIPSFSQRSYELEHLDKGDYTAEEYEGCIVELQRVNLYLGDARSLRRSVLKRIELDGLKEFSLLDVGAGSGELLRVVASWASSSGRRAHLAGLELNERAARAIMEESTGLASSISSVRGDALNLPFADKGFDYVMCSLFTHHLKDEEVVRALCEMSRVACRRLFVIDLHRHRAAYYLYTSVGRLFLHNRLIREDGALSILRSFRPDELRRLAERARLADVKVERRFPFRLVLSAAPGGLE